LLIAAIVSAVLCIIFLIFYTVQSYNPGKLTISAPFGLGTYEFEKQTLSEKELDISWKLYVQLTTRKAAIPIDQDNDIITDVYDSWYELFKSTREYLIDLPASEIQENDNAQEIVRLSLDVLNKGLRPHLTKWQGKYRKWYELEVNKPENNNLSPQEIQKKYPHYNELMGDIRTVNVELNKYADELKRFSHESTPNVPTKIITWFKELKVKIS